METAVREPPQALTQASAWGYSEPWIWTTSGRNCLSTSAQQASPGITDSFILPAKPAGILRALLAKAEGDVDIVKDSKSATFTFGDFSISTRFIKGNYPNYNRVIPENNPFHLSIDREMFVSALRRVALFASQASQLVKLNVQPSEVLLSAQDLDYGTSAEERVNCEYEGNPMVIGFNSQYLLEVLTNLTGETVVGDLSDPARPGLFHPLEKTEGEDIVMLQMPMQVLE